MGYDDVSNIPTGKIPDWLNKKGSPDPFFGPAIVTMVDVVRE